MRTLYPCIIPTLPEDYIEVREYLYKILDMLPVSRIVFIGNNELNKIVSDDAIRLEKKEEVEFVNENDLLSFEAVKESYLRRLEEIELILGKPEKTSRVGWYYQQFLKMEYSHHCNEEYYLCWDADTIPLHPINMFNENGVPFLDIKPEYNPSYFETLKNLFGFEKVIEQSFISEHMLIKKSIMNELLDEIIKLDLNGIRFYDKIFSAINKPYNGFSEFETYGTYVAYRHTSDYRLRQWKSMRNTGFMINRIDLTEDDIDWLATGFDAASFERYHETYPVLTKLFRNPEYRKKIRSDIFYNDLLEEGVFGNYKNGGLVVDNMICPV